jgi:hypothetical protein
MIRVVFLMCPTETMTNVHMHAVKANTVAIRLVQSSVVVITTFHSVGTTQRDTTPVRMRGPRSYAGADSGVHTVPGVTRRRFRSQPP